MSDITITPETIKILKNFSQINQGIKVQPGNVLRTINNVSSVIGKAIVTETFDSDWAIYDLPEFLSAIELFDNPVLNFSKQTVQIKDRGDSEENGIKYRFADPEVINSTSKDVNMPITEVNFTFSDKILARILKTASVLQSPHMIIENSDVRGSVKISLKDVDNPLSNIYAIDIKCEDVVDNKFRFIQKVDNIMVIPGEYNIGISKHKISHWMNGDLNYHLALDNSSTYEE